MPTLDKTLTLTNTSTNTITQISPCSKQVTCALSQAQSVTLPPPDNNQHHDEENETFDINALDSLAEADRKLCYFKMQSPSGTNTVAKAIKTLISKSHAKKDEIIYCQDIAGGAIIAVKPDTNIFMFCSTNPKFDFLIQHYKLKSKKQQQKSKNKKNIATYNITTISHHSFLNQYLK